MVNAGGGWPQLTGHTPGPQGPPGQPGPPGRLVGVDEAEILIKKIDLNPGDVIVAEVKLDLSEEVHNAICASLQATFPDHVSIVLGPAWKITIIDKGEYEKFRASLQEMEKKL